MMKLRAMIATTFFTLFLSVASLPVAQAGMVGTQQLMQDNLQQDLLAARRSISQQLIELGVAQEQAMDRVAQLSDQQVSEITQKLAELPAGADAGGILLTLFIVFVITDVIGATDIFPFIKPVQ